VNGALGGTGRVAGDRYLMTQDDLTSKPLLQPWGLGRAGGLAAGLMLVQRTGLRRGGVVTVSPWPRRAGREPR
jgi:hypothetical protein